MPALLTWQSLIFVIPLVLAATLIGASALGALDIELDVDLDGDADLGEEGSGSDILALLGFGRAPMSIVIVSLLATFGGFGIALGYVFEPLLGRGTLPTLAAAGGAIIAAFFGTAALARRVARHMPSTETYATDASDLIGAVGRIEVRATAIFGVAHVTDRTGTFHQIRCRTDEGVLERGSAVLVTAYDDRNNIYTVIRSPL